MSDGATTLLLDAGIPIKAIQIGCNFKVGDISGALITHAHQDHCKGVKDLAKLGTDIYASQGTLDACGYSGHRFHSVRQLEEFTIDTFKILPFDVQHDAPEPLGFLLTSTATKEKLLYFTDTYYLKYKFQNLNYIMAECNYSEEAMRYSIENGYVSLELAPRLIRSHMSLEHLVDMLKSNDLSEVKQIYLLHLSNHNSNEVAFIKEVQKITGVEVYAC